MSNFTPCKSTVAFDVLTPIRSETALSRYPIHRIAKRGDIKIELKKTDAAGATLLLWEVSYNSKYGQPGPLAYKIDTLVVNRKIEEALEQSVRPLPALIRLGSLRDICRELGHSEGGESLQSARRALLQNASAFINARITYRSNDPARGERRLEAAFNRYGVVFTGESLPDGRTADAVYLVLHDIYREVLSTALLRPLDYEYLKALPPAPQRFYEIVSYQIYAALHHRNPRAKLTYSEYCVLSTQTRYYDWEHVKKQMYKVHKPHLTSGYLAKVEYEAAVDGEGQPDWVMYYVPGPNAAAEYRAFKGGGNRAVQQLPKKPVRQGALPLAFPEAKIGYQAALPEPLITSGPGTQDELPQSGTAEVDLVEALVAQGVGRSVAARLVREKPALCRLHLDAYLPFLDVLAGKGEFVYRNGKGAYLHDAIRHEYGPPKGFVEAQAQEQARQERMALAARQQAEQCHADAFRSAYEAYLGERLDEMEREQPEVFASFTAQEDTERQKLQRIGLSVRRFDSLGQRLVRFRQFFAGKGVFSFWEWDRELNSKGLNREMGTAQ